MYVNSAQQLITKLKIKDFDEFLIMALGSNEFLHDDITKLYENNKELHYELYKNSKYYNSAKYNMCTTLNYENIQKFTGVFLYEKQNYKNIITMNLIKKGFKILFNYIKINNPVNIYNLRNHYLKTVGSKQYATTVKSSHMFAVAIYLCNELKIDIIYDDWDFEKMLKGSFNEDEIVPKLRQLPLDETKIFNYLEKFKNTGIDKNQFKLTLNHFVSAINRQAVEEVRKMPINHEIIDENKILEQARQTPFMESLDYISNILIFYGIDAIDLQSITILNSNKLKQIVQLCLNSNEKEDLSESKIDQLFGFTLILHALCEEYKMTKNEYLKNAHEEALYEVKKLKENYESKLYELTEIENKTTIKLRDSKEIIVNQTSEIAVLKKQLKEKEKELNNLNNGYEKLEKEINELNQVVNIYRREDTKEKLTIDEMIKFINHQKCVIIGGHITWQDKIKTLLPNIRFINVDEVTKDISFLTNYDNILFNESINSHAMFNKIKSLIDSKNIPLKYIGQHTNIELTVQSIYNGLKTLSTN